MDCAKKIFKESGIRGLYKGTGATLLRGVFLLFISEKKEAEVMYSKPLHVLYISKIDNILSVSEFSMTILFFFSKWL